MKQLIAINRSGWYWALLFWGGILLMGVALYFQYGRDEWPCLLCIHVRLGVSAMILVAALGWWLRKRPWAAMALHGLMLAVAVGLLNRSMLLFGTERGTVFGECSMALGLPDWFALDKWLPGLYEVQASCGYTPQLIAGITMAEALLVMSWVLVVISAGQWLIGLFALSRRQWRNG